MTHAVGLHARPSVKLTEALPRPSLRDRGCAVARGPVDRCKSIVKVMPPSNQGHCPLFPGNRGGCRGRDLALSGLSSAIFDESHADAVPVELKGRIASAAFSSGPSFTVVVPLKARREAGLAGPSARHLKPPSVARGAPWPP